MVSNRRGPTSNCGCCAPPCTCLIAKRSFEGTYSNLNLTGPSTSASNPCNSSGSAIIGSGATVSTPIDFDGIQCSDSAGGFACPGGLSHLFENGTSWFLVGRNGGCGGLYGSGTNECPSTDGASDAPCAGSYGTTFPYSPIARWGGGVSWSCDGGNSGTPQFGLWSSAQYFLALRPPVYYTLASPPVWPGFPAAPSGWTRELSVATIFGFPANCLYTTTGATLRFDLFRENYLSIQCTNNTRYENFVTLPGAGAVGGFGVWSWQVSAFAWGAPNVTSLSMPAWPLDPFGILDVTVSIS